MLLRSSSTPVLGSLLPCFTDSPNHHHSEPHWSSVKHPTPPLISRNCNSSPVSHSAAEFSRGSFRRSHSEGNLHSLAADVDDHLISNLIPKPSRCFPCRSTRSILETIPSFSFHRALKCEEDEDSDAEEDDIPFENSFVWDSEKQNSGLSDEMRSSIASRSFEFKESHAQNSEMYLARGLGVENLNISLVGHGIGSGSGNSIPVAFGRDDGDGKRQGVEEHYKNLVEENPENPLLLRNYAQYLFQMKKDLEKSEELYSRAILVDPGDGEVLSQYAKLIWELHHDQDRALSYFERAVQAAPADSHVHAAYASFLWEIEGDEEDEDDPVHSSSIFSSHFRNTVVAPAST